MRGDTHRIKIEQISGNRKTDGVDDDDVVIIKAVLDGLGVNTANFTCLHKIHATTHAKGFGTDKVTCDCADFCPK